MTNGKAVAPEQLPGGLLKLGLLGVVQRVPPRLRDLVTSSQHRRRGNVYGTPEAIYGRRGHSAQPLGSLRRRAAAGGGGAAGSVRENAEGSVTHVGLS